MTKEEGQVSEFIRLFHHIFLEERDFEKLSHMMADEIEWTGTGAHRGARGRETVLRLLEEDFSDQDFSYRILRSEYHVSKHVSCLYLFSGVCYINRAREKTPLREYELRLSGALSFNEEGGLMSQLHHSLPDKECDSALRQTSAENTRILRTLVGRQSRELEETDLNLDVLIRIIMNQMTDILFEWDIRKDTLSFSSNWEKKFGYKPAGENISSVIPMDENLYPGDRKIFKRLQGDMLNGIPYGENEIRLRKYDGSYIWCRIQFTLQTDQSGHPSRVVGLITDIDKEKRENERLKEMAEKDSLTGLLNRGAVQTMVQRCVMKAAEGDCCALIILDVDNFKKINGVYGHLGGDMMLKDIADRLRGLFPVNAVIGRVGGDEFAVLMHHVKAREEVEQRASEILHSFQEILLRGQDTVSCSLGIAMAPENGSDFAAIYKSADSALYRAKRRGKNCYAFYEISCSDCAAQTECRDTEVEEAAFGQELTGYILDLLAHATDMGSAIRQVLEIVGRQVDVSRAYIFEDDEEGTSTSNTFEWCSEDVEPQIDALQKLELTDVDRYYDNFNEDGIFFCKDITALLTRDRRILEAQGIKSILQCLIMEEGKIRGFVGFDECARNRYWTQRQVTVLQMLAKILGMFLLKGRAKERLKKTADVFGRPPLP